MSDSRDYAIKPEPILDGQPSSCPECEKLTAERDRYRETLEHIFEYWNRARNDMAMYDALNHIMDTAESALAGKE